MDGDTLEDFSERFAKMESLTLEGRCLQLIRDQNEQIKKLTNLCESAQRRNDELIKIIKDYEALLEKRKP